MVQREVDIKIKDVQWCTAPWQDPRTDTRINHLLARNGIETVEQLLTYSRKDLARINGLGKICLRSIVNKLHAMGLQLK